MSYKYLLVEKEESIAIITLNRPEAMNAFSLDMIREMGRVMRDLEKDKKVKVIIITGAGRAFSVGGDLNEYKNATIEWMAENNRSWLETLRVMEKMRKPIIAAVNGFANIETYQACDLVIISEEAKVGLPEINIGVKPGAGIDQRLPRWIGRLKTKELLFFGDWISAKEAERIGVVNKVTPADGLMDTAKEWAKRLAAKSQPAIGAIKVSVNIGADMELDLGLEYQLQEFIHLFETPEQKAGMKAFFEKRGDR
ncbi:enoyl-CoA hydratase/isomerase family protein [Chloroflexota bacterium]